MLLPKVGDRPMRRKVAGRYHPIRHILFQLLRDAPQRERAGGIGIQQNGEHHLRIERSIASPISLVGRMKCLEIQSGHGVGDEERQSPSGSQSRGEGGNSKD